MPVSTPTTPVVETTPVTTGTNGAAPSTTAPTSPKGKGTSKPKARVAAAKSGKKTAAKPEPVAGGRGSAVGWKAKTTVDCRWNATRVAFYKALRKIGGSGKAKDISEASGGEVSVGNCLGYGYHGVAPGYNTIEEPEEGERGFTFRLTAKGRNLNLDKVLEKSNGKKE